MAVGSDTHITVIGQRNEPCGMGTSRAYQAQCMCGWTGRWVNSFDLARSAAFVHRTAAKL